MSASDAILIGEGWISEHYLTTDANKQSFRARVLTRRKEWEEQKDTGSVRSRFTSVRGHVLSQLASLEDNAERAAELREELIEVLGYNSLGLVHEVSGPVTFVRQVGLPDGPSLALIAAKPVGTAEDLLEKDDDTLSEPYEVDEGTQLWSASRLLSALFVAEDPPDFALVFAGRVMLIAERERWPEGRYLAIDLQLVAERSDDRRGGETETALACISAESLAPDAEGNIWWHAVLEESIRHTVGVSSDLREGVRLSIEIIANDVVARRATRGLPPLPNSEAQTLAKQSLRFLYRILFLLYAEASPELGVLPTGAVEYEQGYSLDRLRDLIQVPLTSPQADTGTHLYESLEALSELVDRGYVPVVTGEDEGLREALTFRSLKADLFRPEATALIDEVKLSNAQLQRVLQHLLLSKEKKGNDRGFISYAELGINQLGAVYEGLMSYTGRFAETDLFEVAKGGDGSKGSWLVPVERAGSIADKDFVRYEDPITGERKPVLHTAGAFVFRLAGRERQQSASYYTPEVLTRFTVNQALTELIGPDAPVEDSIEWSGREVPRRLAAEEILGLTVCEPALGSGAFAIEAVRQLASAYLLRRQEELGVRIDPEDYPRELQKVKAYIALHNVYGVDLNATAVELAEISLWLDTMMEGLQAPWFGLHLRRGNSLIGARHAVYDRAQIEKKSWLNDVPRHVPLTELPSNVRDSREGSASGSVYHFLLPATGWGAAINAKEAKALAPEALAALRAWRRRILAKPTKKQIDSLIDLSRRVEVLWQLAWRRLSIAEREIRRSVDVWGAEEIPVGGAVTREQIEESLSNPNGAYRRLRWAMDAWCALWFWPLTEETEPPSLDTWIETLQALLGRVGSVKKVMTGQLSLASAVDWDDLEIAEQTDLGYSLAVDVAKILDDYPWVAAAERIAAQQGFFHWELEFAPVFTEGGFDLQVGNPPWVRPRSDVEALLAEADPWWQLKANSTRLEEELHRESALAVDGMREMILDDTAEIASIGAFVGSANQFPLLVGLPPDLYRCFMEQTWRHAKPTGLVGLIHPETHFTDEKAGLLRTATYRRLRRHWQFINELSLFEVHHLVSYGVHTYGALGEPGFIQATSLYHPDTVDRSLKHDGSGTEPGLKDENGKWDLRPHASRIQHVNLVTLGTWHAVLEPENVPVGQSRMVYTLNQAAAAVLHKLASVPRIADLGMSFSTGWNQTIDRDKGFFDLEWGVPESWESVILQGPHLHVANPFYKAPKPTMLHNQDWTTVDLEALPLDAIPATSYKPRGDRAKYDAAYTHWGERQRSSYTAARDHYRIAWRRRTANTGVRTLIPAIIPPGVSHVHPVYTLALPKKSVADLVLVAGFLSSLLADFSVRSVPKSEILFSTVERMPFSSDATNSLITLRMLKLTCLSDAFGRLWSECYRDKFRTDRWAIVGSDRFSELGVVGPEWSPAVPLRTAWERRRALLEVDVLVAIAVGVSVDELCTIYRTQFPVLYGYDRGQYVYDANGRIVPNSILALIRKNGPDLPEEDRTLVHPGSGVAYVYEPPFRHFDREADMREAYREFERRLNLDV